jgi:hypothetical protein
VAGLLAFLAAAALVFTCGGVVNSGIRARASTKPGGVENELVAGPLTESSRGNARAVSGGRLSQDSWWFELLGVVAR